MYIEKKRFGIGAKDGIIYIEKIKPFGKKTMNISDYLNGSQSVKDWSVK